MPLVSPMQSAEACRVRCLAVNHALVRPPCVTTGAPPHTSLKRAGGSAECGTVGRTAGALHPIICIELVVTAR